MAAMASALIATFMTKARTPSTFQITDDDGSFTVKIASTGKEYVIPTDQTIIEVLREDDIEIPVSCEQGICGTCMTNVLEGTPDHRDLYMTDAEKEANNKMTPCCSRALSDSIVLDL